MQQVKPGAVYLRPTQRFRRSLTARFFDKEDLALLEHSDFNAEKAKQYLKKSSKKIALRLIENKDEENLVKLLRIDIASKQLLEMLLEKAEEMPTARAYILEMLGNTKTNKSFSI